MDKELSEDDETDDCPLAVMTGIKVLWKSMYTMWLTSSPGMLYRVVRRIGFNCFFLFSLSFRLAI